MGWANCGKDSNGRPIGYAHRATCDHPECDEPIDRGLSYACGDAHGQNEHDCEGYFCTEHLEFVTLENGRWLQLCMACAKQYERRERE